MTEDLAERVRLLEQQIAALKERNARVDFNKAWETSRTRKLSLVVLTYLFMCLLFFSLGAEAPWRQSLVPTLGYILSTLGLPLIQRLWKSRQNL